MSEIARVAVAQVPARIGDIQTNLASLERWLQDAAADGARLVIFPECFLSGYMFEDRPSAVAAAVAIDGPEVATIVSLCRRFDIDAVIGLLERAGDKLYNSALVVGPDGVIGVHRKRHMPYLGADRFVDEPDGTAPSLFETRAGRVGVAICYEIRFPEVMRTLALAGADFIALPTNWPVQSVLLADYFTRVRAAENFVYLLVANRADAEGDAEFLGKSQVIDPLGNVLVNAGKDEGVVAVDADVSRARNKTITFQEGTFELSPWKDRRPATYHIA